MSKYQRALRTFDAAAITGNFQDVGDPIPFPTMKVTFINTSGVDVLITDQSSEEDIRIPANGTMSIGEGRVKINYDNNSVVFDKNAQLQIKQVTGAGVGTIIIQLFG